jgi:electron transfer flavoprotein alpha subunit
MITPSYTADEARGGIWVYVERGPKGLEGVSLELLGHARHLADLLTTQLTGVLIGHGLEDAAHEAIRYGVDRVLLADHAELAQFAAQPYTRVVAEAVLAERPGILLIGATPDGRDLAGRLAVRLRTGLTADCTGLDLEPDTGLLLGHTTGFGGGVTATIKCPVHRPQMATVRPGVLARPRSDPARVGRLDRLSLSLRPEDRRVEVLERSVGVPEVDLTRAKVVVVGGRGAADEFRLLEELAHLLGGEVGATRVAVDSGWAERERQIGQTGYVTHPDLAIVCGASGAMQFTVGIQQAGSIVAVNTDSEAPIFELADYVVIDDVGSILPPLVARLRETHSVAGE